MSLDAEARPKLRIDAQGRVRPDLTAPQRKLLVRACVDADRGVVVDGRSNPPALKLEKIGLLYTVSERTSGGRFRTHYRATALGLDEGARLRVEP